MSRSLYSSINLFSNHIAFLISISYIGTGYNHIRFTG